MDGKRMCHVILYHPFPRISLITWKVPNVFVGVWLMMFEESFAWMLPKMSSSANFQYLHQDSYTSYFDEILKNIIDRKQ